MGGTGVTIALVDNAVALNWNGATVRLAAPKTGSYAGMVVIGVRDQKSHTFNASTIDLHGVVYLLQGDLTWANTGTPTIHSKWTAWIVDGFSWSGDGTIRINFDLQGSDIPYPGTLNVIPRTTTARLVN